MTLFMPGYPPNFQANLPFASTMTTKIPARAPTTNNSTTTVITHPRWNGQ
jgi:hypothetical protein